MNEEFYIVPEDRHNELVDAAYRARGFSPDEAAAAARFAAHATRHGIRTHNALKALSLDDRFGSKAAGCVPGAEIEVLPCRFEACEIWNAHRKLGQATAEAAMARAIELADRYGIAQISIDNSFHYLWGGGYVMDAARKGYIAYTNCTASLAEVVPFGGRRKALGTNPHSWGFPTVEAIGYPIVIDWATSVVAMGRVQQLRREGGTLPPLAAVDKDGKPTTDPVKAEALLPFGAHKGYGLSLINELVAAFIGGSLPSIRNHWDREKKEDAGKGEKYTTDFYFQVIHPDSLNAGLFVQGRTQAENVRAVLQDILADGNEDCMLPGQIEAEACQRSQKAGGLLFSKAEVSAFNDIAGEVGQPAWVVNDFPKYTG